MTDEEAMLAELDGHRWRVMLALADWCEENGQPEMAAGWRWLAEHEKWPRRPRKDWPRWDDWSDATAENAERYTEVLPGPVRTALAAGMEHRSSRPQTEAALLRLTARAVGLWLAGKEGEK